MRLQPKCRTVFRMAAAIAALGLGAGSASAGGGGADAGNLQASLNAVCAFLQQMRIEQTCPQLPTVTQLILQIAGLENAAPEMVRYTNSVPTTSAVNAANPPAGQSPVLLSNIAVPLAFHSPSVGGANAAAAVKVGNPSANSFFYAATNGLPIGLSPDTLSLFYDYPPLTHQSFAKGQFIADIALPLVVLNNDGTETPAPATIQFRGATGCGQASPCVSATAKVNIPVKGIVLRSPSDLGVTATLDYSTGHAVFGLSVKLIVTQKNNAAYFSNPISAALPAVFTSEKLGFTPKFLGLPVGLAPDAVPFTAIIANDGGASVPAVNAYLAVATDGETLVSAPLP